MAVATFSGLASGIDSAALIDAIIESREIVNQQRQADIDFLESENDALEELNTKFLALNDLIDQFRTSNNGGVLKKTNSSDASVATAIVGSNAQISSFGLTVTSIANVATASFDDSYTGISDQLAPNAVGTQAIDVLIGQGGDQVTVSVNITSATTIQQYVDSFNADPNASGRAVANVINVGTSASPDYRVTFTTLEQGRSLGDIAFSIPTAGAGFGGNSDLQNRTVNQATDAVFSLDGIAGSITRSSNTVDDVVTGVTLQLFDSGSTTITVSNDADETADLVAEIVEAYNDIVDYIAENDTVERVENSQSGTNIFGTLAKTRVDNDFIEQFRSALSGAASANGTEVTSGSEIGIKTNRDGSLTFDADKFKEKIGQDTVGVQEVLRSFADASAGVSGFINQFTRFEGFIDLAQSSNSSEIENLQKAITDRNRANDQVRAQLQARFANLEKLTGQLQSSGNALNGILAGLQ